MSSSFSFRPLPFHLFPTSNTLVTVPTASFPPLYISRSLLSSSFFSHTDGRYSTSVSSPPLTSFSSLSFSDAPSSSSRSLSASLGQSITHAYLRVCRINRKSLLEAESPRGIFPRSIPLPSIDRRAGNNRPLLATIPSFEHLLDEERETPFVCKITD